MDKVALPKAYVIHLFVRDERYYFSGYGCITQGLCDSFIYLKNKDIISVDMVALPKACLCDSFF